MRLDGNGFQYMLGECTSIDFGVAMQFFPLAPTQAQPSGQKWSLCALIVARPEHCPSL